MKLLLIIILVSIICISFISTSIKRQRYESLFIIIPGITIILSQTSIPMYMTHNMKNIIIILSLITIFLANLSSLRMGRPPKERSEKVE